MTTDNNMPKEIWDAKDGSGTAVNDVMVIDLSEIAASHTLTSDHAAEIEKRDRAIEVLMGAIKNIDSARCKKRLGVPELILSAMDYAAQANKKAQAILNGEDSE